MEAFTAGHAEGEFEDGLAAIGAFLDDVAVSGGSEGEGAFDAGLEGLAGLFGVEVGREGDAIGWIDWVFRIHRARGGGL